MSHQKITELREACCHFGSVLADYGWAPGSSGNISVRIDESRFMITPSGSGLGDLKPNDLCVVFLEEAKPQQSSSQKPSSELPMHRVVYEKLPSIDAVIHAHPPYIIALSIHKFDFQRVILPESILTLGRVGVAPYSLPASNENAMVVSQLVDRFQAIVLPRHGSVTIGESLTQALNRLESLESIAKTIHLAQQIKEVSDLPVYEVERLWEHRRKMM